MRSGPLAHMTNQSGRGKLLSTWRSRALSVVHKLTALDFTGRRSVLACEPTTLRSTRCPNFAVPSRFLVQDNTQSPCLSVPIECKFPCSFSTYGFSWPRAPLAAQIAVFKGNELDGPSGRPCPIHSEFSGIRVVPDAKICGSRRCCMRTVLGA